MSNWPQCGQYTAYSDSVQVIYFSLKQNTARSNPANVSAASYPGGRCLID